MRKIIIGIVFFLFLVMAGFCSEEPITLRYKVDIKTSSLRTHSGCQFYVRLDLPNNGCFALERYSFDYTRKIERLASDELYIVDIISTSTITPPTQTPSNPTNSTFKISNLGNIFLSEDPFNHTFIVFPKKPVNIGLSWINFASKNEGAIKRSGTYLAMLIGDYAIENERMIDVIYLAYDFFTRSNGCFGKTFASLRLLPTATGFPKFTADTSLKLITNVSGLNSYFELMILVYVDFERSMF